MNFTNRFPALRSRDFIIFWVGQFVSLIGTWMQNTTQPYLAYRLTGKPLDLGIIGFAATLPTLILALPGGVLVERLDKRRTVITMQIVMMVQAFVLAFLAMTGIIKIWHIILLAVILGAANTIEITARQAMLVELVGKSSLPNAIALQATIFNTARVLGPSLSAVVLVLVKNQGEGWAFLINGFSFLFVIIGLFFVRTPYRLPIELKTEPTKPGILSEFREGQHYVKGNSFILIIILLAALIGFFGFPFNQQIPAVARTVLQQIGDTETIVKARNSALYMAQGVGALIAALLISFFSSLKRKGLLLTIGQFVFAFALIVLSFTTNLPFALILILFLGWSMVIQLSMMNTLIQIEVPDALRGRVFSTYLWALQGVAPFGSLLIGWIAQSWGVPTAALVCGTICFLALIIFHSAFPSLRRKLS